MKSFYPLAGSVVGGSAGAIGGPLTAGIGAGAGWAAGEVARGNKDLQDAQQAIQALTTGDVDKLVELKLADAKDNGYFDSILDGVYDFIKLCAIGLAVWLAFQFWLNHKLAKKAIKEGKE